jgi:thioredoxin-like negative regulator of GroEL
MHARKPQIFLALLILLAPSYCFAQSGSIPGRKSVSGYIREDGSGQVLKGARVQILTGMGTPISYVYSDGNGGYSFDDVGQGDFYVEVEHAGYTTVREFVRPDGSPHVYKDVFLKPVGGEAAPTAVSPVSQHDLKIPPKAKETFNKGVDLIANKSDYRGAIGQFSKAIEKYPDYYEAYAAMGLAQFHVGDSKGAEASLRKSIELSSETYPQALTDLGSMFNGQKRYAEAEPLLRKSVEADAKSWRGQYELALALGGQNRFKEAAASASAAHDLKPDNTQICLLLYNLHIQSDDFAAALRDADDYLKASPNGTMADRVRKMRDQLQKDMQAAGAQPAPTHP